METPKNQHQQVIWYLLNWNYVTMVKVIKDSFFYKFQTRLSDIELKHGSITEKTTEGFKNRFGRQSHYTVYKIKDRAKALWIYDQL